MMPSFLGFGGPIAGFPLDQTVAEHDVRPNAPIDRRYRILHI